MGLKAKLTFRLLTGVLVFGAVLFIPAGSFKFWQGWAYLLIWMVPGLSAFAYAYKHDLKLIERRMEVKEKVPAQKLIMKFIYLIYLAAILLPGLDYRFGWSHVPLWLTVVSQAVVFLGFATTIWVLLVNSFASRTIQVEPGQQVISTGPYSIVRHPMYLGASVMLLFTSMALGSFVALPIFALLIPFIVLRLLNEEKVLRLELAGYSEYCSRTQFRLIPFVW